MKKRTYGSGSFRKIEGGCYQLRYHGQAKHVEAANDKQADRALNRWVDEIEEGEKAGPEVTINHLLDLHIADLRRKKRSDILAVEQKINKHLRPFLGAMDATLIKQRDIKRFIDHRIAQGAEHATINRMLSALRRALNLGIEDELIGSKPTVNKLPEDNARQGFVEENVYRLFLNELADHAKMPWVFCYYVGLRKGELLRLRWEWVSWDRWQIEVPRTITKNKKTRVIPVYSEMRDFLKFAYQTRNPECPFIFQYQGRQLKSFRTAFEKARKRLKLPEVLFHDLRRTAVRNMDREGIQRTAARQVSGHLTESIYVRYSISAEKDVPEVAQRMERYHAEVRSGSEKLWTKLWTGESGHGKEEGPDTTGKLKQ